MNILNMIKEDASHWYAVYTNPRHEKKVHQSLLNLNIESFCPLNKVLKQWSDRKKIVFEPLFPSYVFVKTNHGQMPTIRAIQGVLNFVYWDGKPAIIREEEIIKIKNFTAEYTNIEVIPQDTAAIGQEVAIKTGILMDKRAKISAIANNYIELIIVDLGLKLLAKKQTC